MLERQSGVDEVAVSIENTVREQARTGVRSHSTWSLSSISMVIVCDEAGRTPELFWLHPVTTFPHALVRIKIGDPAQCPYEVTSRDAHRDPDTKKKFLASYLTHALSGCIVPVPPWKTGAPRGSTT